MCIIAQMGGGEKGVFLRGVGVWGMFLKPPSERGRCRRRRRREGRCPPDARKIQSAPLTEARSLNLPWWKGGGAASQRRDGGMLMMGDLRGRRETPSRQLPFLLFSAVRTLALVFNRPLENKKPPSPTVNSSIFSFAAQAAAGPRFSFLEKKRGKETTGACAP